MAITRLGPNQDITAAKIAGTINFKNLIINGDMSIAQRGTSASSLTVGGYSTHDRWIRGMANAGTWTQSQDTDVPTGQGFAKSLKLDCTTASTPIAADGNLNIGMRFEGQMLQQLKYGTSNAESLTLSFWVKSTKTGTFYAEFYNFDDTRHISKSYTVNASDTWEKKTITFEGDIAGTITNDNTSSLYLLMWLAAGSNFTSGTHTGVWEATVNANRLPGQVNCADSTSNNFYLTGVQLEAGTTASDFEFLPYDVNLQRCQRYYHQIGHGLNGAGGTVNAGQGQWYNSSEVTLTVYFPTSMRATPSMTTPTVSSGYRFHSAGSFVDVSDGGSINGPSNMMTGIYKSGLSGGSGGQASFLAMIASGASYKFDAEL
jgi:hypothetical protein